MWKLLNELVDAILAGDEEKIKALIAGGLDVNAVSPDGATVLMVAAANGKLQAARLLLEAGADANVAEGDGWTALTGVTGVYYRTVDASPTTDITYKLISGDTLTVDSAYTAPAARKAFAG